MRVRHRRFSTAGLFGWNGIKAASMPGMTFAQPSPSEPTAAYYPMLNDSLLRVVGAAGIKATMLTQKRTDAELIASQ